MKREFYESRTQCYSVWTDWQSTLHDLLRLRTDWQAVLRCIGVLLLAVWPAVSAAAEVVRAELGEDEVWTGQAVPLYVTLYSPGPFSGTASFDLPELPLTTFVKIGNPLVGSEQIDDDSYFTQRHEFALYTQRDEEVVVPAFCVRFAGKKSFTSAVEPREGFTQELRFRSTRPPGTEHVRVVVAARNLEANPGERPPPDTAAEFEHESQVLSRHVFGAGPSDSVWSGPRLAVVFLQVRRKLDRAARTKCATANLPALQTSIE